LPELGLVLNLKEKKAVLNPTIIPETVAGNQEAASNPSSHTQLVGFHNPVRITCTMENVVLLKSHLEKIISCCEPVNFFIH
jgi:transcription initiation factor TFIID subunit 2